MNRVFHMAILLAVAVHMVFGCCLHHAHGSVPLASATTVSEHACSCDQHGHDDHGEPGDGGGEHDGCDGDRCVFTHSDSSNGAASPEGLYGLVTASSLPVLPTLSHVTATEVTPASPGIPIPLHLLNQAFLL